MKVAVYYKNNDVRIEEIPRPKINDGELLVQMKATGICGTDVMEWYRIKKAPRILGHEMTGEIVESKSQKHKIGQRVFVSHHVPCYECEYCKEENHTACEALHKGSYEPGGYSEFVRVPKLNVRHGIYILPEHISYEEGTMTEPLACAIRGQRVVGVKKDQTIFIQGCGISGLLHILVAKQNGAKVIATDLNPYRIKKAKEMGADSVFTADQKINLQADRVIICTGAYAAVTQAFQTVKRKGVILLFAIPNRNIEIPTADAWRNEITISSSYGAAPQDLEESLEWIKSGRIKIKPLISHHLPLEQIQEGFDITCHANESLKVVLFPGT
jgi:L-iditol 2-dehydrogenase